MNSNVDLKNFGKKEDVMISEKHIIKVNKEITPIHYTKRAEPVLQVGTDYYVFVPKKN
jgi:hypothetical protein